jgi:hypothetical protein
MDNQNNCVFDVAKLQAFPKSYLALLKRSHFDLTQKQSTIGLLLCAHVYSLDENVYVHHSDCDKLNNKINNLAPLDKEFFDNLEEEKRNNLAKVHQYIPAKYKPEVKKKTKEAIKLEYRACDLYYNHDISPDKVSITLRNRLNKAQVIRAIKLYTHFKAIF